MKPFIQAAIGGGEDQVCFQRQRSAQHRAETIPSESESSTDSLSLEKEEVHN